MHEVENLFVRAVSDNIIARVQQIGYLFKGNLGALL